MSFAVEALCLFFFLGQLSTVQCTATETVATCSAEPVIEGETGVMHLSFPGQIEFDKDQTYFYLLHENEDILQCDGAVCAIKEDYAGRFKIESQGEHSLTLRISPVTPDLLGVYVLGGYLNGSPIFSSRCRLSRVVGLLTHAPAERIYKDEKTDAYALLATFIVFSVACAVLSCSTRFLLGRRC